MIIGITGKSAVGKTTMAQFWKKQYYAQHIELDVWAKKLYEQNNTKVALKREFGKRIFHKNKIIISELKKILVQNHNNLQKLNKILLPALRKQVIAHLNKANKEKQLIVVEGAVLLECDLNDYLDQTILLKTSKKIQLKRATWKDQPLEKKMINIMQRHWQWDEANFNHVLQNSYKLTYLYNQAKAIMTKIITKIPK